LLPKLCFSRGSLVELLIKSGVGRYLEFKNIESTFMYIDGQIEKSP